MSETEAQRSARWAQARAIHRTPEAQAAARQRRDNDRAAHGCVEGLDPRFCATHGSRFGSFDHHLDIGGTND